jgi:hypothetical protein
MSVTEPRDWPWEPSAKGSLRPWYSTTAGYLMVIFRDPKEAERARRDLLEHGVPDEELRLLLAEESLRIHSRLQEERSSLAKAIAALGVDRPGRHRYLDNARAGGAAIWIVAPTKDRADRLVGLLADYDYQWMRYLGKHDVEDISGDVG